jgi:hypothetical protein
MLVTTDYLCLNRVLIKMVRDNKITAEEREALLHKAGLLKLTDGRWRESESSVLTLQNI